MEAQLFAERMRRKAAERQDDPDERPAEAAAGPRDTMPAKGRSAGRKRNPELRKSAPGETGPRTPITTVKAPATYPPIDEVISQFESGGATGRRLLFAGIVLAGSAILIGGFAFLSGML